MAKHRNTYSKGLNQDTSRSKYDQSNYYDALNIRVVTDEGLSTGSIENERGNSLNFVIPDLPAEPDVVFLDGTSAPVPAQEGLKIVGWTTLEDKVIIFTTNETSETPDSYGQIWSIEYDEATGTIIGILPGNILDPEVHLRYNHKLNLSSFHRIEAVTRYENTETQRVYWTDFNSELRTVNIADPELRDTSVTPTKTLDPKDIDTRPEIIFGKSTPVGVSVGNLPAAGKVQYAYRLINSQGVQTVISPASELVSLTETAPNTGDVVDYFGADSNSSDARSVTFNVTGIDTSFDVIEHIAILYITKDVPSIFKFGEDYIPDSGEINIELNGNETRIPISEIEYSTIRIGFDTCKTIAIKDNRLVAGNIKTKDVDTAYDARAYRFNRNKISLLRSKVNEFLPGVAKQPEDLEINGNSPVWPESDANVNAMEAEHDLINPYNSEDPTENSDWVTADQYKYKADGVTLGGEGPNIQYTFHTEELVGDSGVTFSEQLNAPFINVTSTGGRFNSLADPIKEATLTGYSRGEVYRFGIEFYLKKGENTFVEWIGDIKFPDPSILPGSGGNAFSVADAGAQASGGEDLVLKSLGITFTVDVSSLSDQISGFKIVRAERKESDRTRLGTGTIFLTGRKDPDSGLISDTLYTCANQIGAKDRGSVIPLAGQDDVKIDGVDGENNIFTLLDTPGIDFATNSPHVDFNSTKGAVNFISPISSYREDTGYGFKEGDYLKTYGYYRAIAKQYVKGDDSNDNFQRMGWMWKARTFEDAVHDTGDAEYESFKIVNVNHLKDGDVLGINSSILPKALAGNKFMNTSYGIESATSGGNRFESPTDREVPPGIGRDTCLMELHGSSNSGTTVHNSANIMSWNTTPTVIYPQTFAFGSEDFLYVDNFLAGQEYHTFKQVGYCRKVSGQYGGNTYTVRSKQQYISTGQFQPVTVGGATSFTFNLFGGDTYVNYWDKEFLQQAISNEYQNEGDNLEDFTETPRSIKHSVAAIFPVESFINTDLTYGVHFAKNRKGTSYSDYIEIANRSHENVYIQENNGQNKYFAKDFIDKTTEEFSHRLWASDKKLDGEFIDSWRIFKDNNYIEVEGNYGPINKVINFQDKLLYYQSRAFGVGSINERSMITDSAGVEVAVGTGSVLDHFRYISTETGSFHQFGVIKSNSSVYHYDAYLNKMYRLSNNGAVPLADMEGMASFFHNTVEKAIINTDRTLRNQSTALAPIGIHGVYDYRYNRVMFTFLFSDPEIDNFTISFSEYLDSFESFYSFKPSLYLEAGRRVLSAENPGLPVLPDTTPLASKTYLHNVGERGVFYDNAPEPSYVTLLVSPAADIPKMFHNLEYNSEVFSKDLDAEYTINERDETITSLEYFTDYQASGVIPVVVPTNVKRRMRHWRHTLIRDQNSLTQADRNQNARFRDYHIFLKLSFDNANDRRLVLHDVITSYMPARD